MDAQIGPHGRPRICSTSDVVRCGTRAQRAPTPLAPNFLRSLAEPRPRLLFNGRRARQATGRPRPRPSVAEDASCNLPHPQPRGGKPNLVGRRPRWPARIRSAGAFREQGSCSHAPGQNGAAFSGTRSLATSRFPASPRLVELPRQIELRRDHRRVGTTHRRPLEGDRFIQSTGTSWRGSPHPWRG